MAENLEAAGGTGLLEQRTAVPAQVPCITSFHFETYRTTTTIKAIETANRKLARAGVTERFTYRTTIRSSRSS